MWHLPCSSTRCLGVRRHLPLLLFIWLLTSSRVINGRPYVHVGEIVIERAGIRLNIDLVLLMAEIRTSILNHPAGSNFHRFLLMSLVSRYPDVDLPIKAIVLLVVGKVSRVANNLMHPCVDNLGRLFHHKYPAKIKRVCCLQSAVYRVALNPTSIDSQDRELGDLTPIHELVYLVRDHAHD